MPRPRKNKCPYCATVPDGMVCDECGGVLTGPCRTQWTDGAHTLVCALNAGHKGNHSDKRGWKFSDDAVKASRRFTSANPPEPDEAELPPF